MSIPNGIVTIPASDLALIALKEFGDLDDAKSYFQRVISCLEEQGQICSPFGVEQEEIFENVGVQMSARNEAVSVNEKFLQDKSTFVLKYGDKTDFMAGLESYVGRPKNPHILQCMKDEHIKSLVSNVEFSPSNNPQLVTTPFEEWLFVMDSAAYFSQAIELNRYKLERRVIAVKELMCMDICVKAKLNEAEVVAARLYTGPMFKLYNDVLRNPPGPGRQSFVYTIHAFASCIIKLSRVHKITTLYRGIKGGALPHAFLAPDEYGSRGGVEYGFMSTTTEKHVAYDYAIAKDGSAKKAAVIYEIDEGGVDRGADVSWLSQFPTENEVVFPPLTNLEVFGEPKAVDGAIVTKLRVNINLRTLTVDEIVEKSRSQFLHMLDWYMEEVRTAALDFDPYLVLPTWLDDFVAFKNTITALEGSRFNQHEFYRKAVDDALDLKEGTIHKVRVLKLLGEINRQHTHDEATFMRTITRLRETRASTFADSKFVMRYVSLQQGACDEEGNIAMSNYDLLWTLPLKRGSWARLVRSGKGAAPVRVSTRKTWAQALRDFIFSFAFFKGLWRQLINYVAVDSLLGFDGVYYCVGVTPVNGKPFYQLSSKDMSLSCKYIYFKGTRWYIGSVLESDWGDLESITENDETPTHVRQWGKTTAPVLMAYIASTHAYVLDPFATVSEVKETSDQFDIYDEVEVHVASLMHSSSWSAAESDVNFHDGQKWAFVHRMVEESQQARIGADTVNEEATNVKQRFGKSELRSIAAYCEQALCPMPKEVLNHLRDDGTHASMSSAFFTVAICTSLWMGLLLVAILGLESFDVFHAIDFESLNWFMRGYFASLAVIGSVFWSMLALALLGRSFASVVGIAGVFIFVGVIYFEALLSGNLLVDRIIGGSIAFVLTSTAIMLGMGLLFALFVG